MSFVENIPTIHPIKDMKINNEELERIMEKKEKLKESKLKSEKKL
jgi:hypothetical protein